jgi:predicted ATPase
MVSRLARLPADVRGVLQIAAIVGNRFDLRVLLLVTGIARTALRGRLHRAVLGGLLLNAGVSSDGENEEYRFLHDRVQQAAAGLMDEDETRRAHLSIGRLLRDSIEHIEDDNRPEVLHT